ncbi:DUF7563 family protein [Natronococcus occultus]
MPRCDSCEATVSRAYHRVHADNDGVLHACCHCTLQADMLQGAGAGIEE